MRLVKLSENTKMNKNGVGPFKSVYVNLDHMISMARSQQLPLTILTMGTNGGLTSMEVAEAPEEIVRLIEQS